MFRRISLNCFDKKTYRQFSSVHRIKNHCLKTTNTKTSKNVDIQDLKIGTWNVYSLYRTETLTTVEPEFDKYGLAILAIQEARWPRSGNQKTEKATLIYSG